MERVAAIQKAREQSAVADALGKEVDEGKRIITVLTAKLSKGNADVNAAVVEKERVEVCWCFQCAVL